MNHSEHNTPAHTQLAGSKKISNEVESVDLSILAGFEDPASPGDSDLIVELIDLYLAEAPRLLTLFKEGLANKDWPAITRVVHSLRGSSSNLGILQMALICEEIEDLQVSDVVPVAGKLFTSLNKEFVRVNQVLNGERKRRTS
jgi:histidine phosphotransfer protein HptB